MANVRKFHFGRKAVQPSTSTSQPVTTTLRGMVCRTLSRKDVASHRNLAYLLKFFSKDEWQMEDGDSNDSPRLKCNGQFFELQTTSEKVICSSLVHFPVQSHDAIFGQANLVSVSDELDRKGKVVTKGGIYYQFIQPPLGMAGQSSDALYYCFKTYSNGRVTGKVATDIFNQLIRYRKDVTSANEISIAFEEMSKMSENYRKLPVPQLDGVLGELDGKTCKVLLSRWYWYYLRRRIELLGINRNDITQMTKIGYSMTKIYEMIMTNAFTILPMSIAMAEDLKKKLGQSYTQFDMEVAIVARKIYHKTISINWTCVPVSTINVMTTHSVIPDMRQRTLDALTGVYGMVLDLDSIYFEGRFKEEVLVSERLLMARKEMKPYDTGNLIFTSRVGILTDEQRSTIADVMRNPISLINGGAGTGKTTIIEQICQNLENQGIACGIVAFTGKAVSRVKEHVRSQYKPMTIHSLCHGGWDENPEIFTHLIIDEASMVTISHLAMIYNAFDHSFGITFVGDINQLEPIEWGYLYKELLKSGVFKVNQLHQNLRIIRDGNRNTMFINTENIAHLIEGDRQVNEKIDLFDIKLKLLDEINYHGEEILHEDDDPVESLIPQSATPNVLTSVGTIAMLNKDRFNFAVCSKFSIIPGGLSNVKAKYEDLIDRGVEPKDVVILSPYNRVIPELNRLAQEISIIDRSTPIYATGRVYYDGDIVLMTRNDYTVNIMNGTSGELIEHERKLNKHRMTQITIHNRNSYGGDVYTGYTEIQFVTGEVARFFIDPDDHNIYKWCISVIPLLTIPPMGTDIKPHSEEEWKTLLTCLNRVYQYYIKYQFSPFSFTSSPLFARHEVQMIFEPLTRITGRYGYMGDITHGYAMTVHKSEGSQWAHVIPYIDYESNGSSFLNNTLLYTMLTRAEESVTCIGDPGGFKAAALQSISERCDRLAVRLMISTRATHDSGSESE